ncbi:hypothetical protein BESB_057570 [Besnoitia besnoiti]|uniref:Uncharacterized protein n=1 Tax=Besnoitia besnoiti TaxID=94643 RepID=A0A2A9MJF8_BESBE|nr:hypothetical protein BESB_057570 [Besnoitia besnoiti]PFH36106.1 hypothetical protein BESB_057570 [Besnoitia besnoiti]
MSRLFARQLSDDAHHAGEKQNPRSSAGCYSDTIVLPSRLEAEPHP